MIATKRKLTPKDMETIKRHVSLVYDYLDTISSNKDYEQYKFDPLGFIRDCLNWEPWSSPNGKVGQVEIIEAYTLSLRQQHEHYEYRNGRLSESDLKHWRIGQPIKTWFAIDAGHNVGKTWLLACLHCHFLFCFVPSIIYSYAPSETQIKLLLWKEIGVSHKRGKLPGRLLKNMKIEIGENHFAAGRATDNSHGQGSERLQGQHNDYLMFVVDEAEGVPEFVKDSIDSMTTGGIAHIVLVARNPRTSSCWAHDLRGKRHVEHITISCLDHPNVLTGKDIVPNSVTRHSIDKKLDSTKQEWVTVVDKHDSDHYTFEVPWRPGIIYQPKSMFLWRVLGVAGSDSTTNTFCPAGRFDAAINREPIQVPMNFAQIGVDAARYGSDFGTVYVMHGGKVWREAIISKQDTYQYYLIVKDILKHLDSIGVTQVSLRVDGGGAYGSFVDQIRASYELSNLFDALLIHEVSFNGLPYDESLFADIVTEMYYEASEAMKYLSLDNPPQELRKDLCERQYKHNKISAAAAKRLYENDKTKDMRFYLGLDVKVLEPKEAMKRKSGRSPDDGDGFVLCASPERIFTPRVIKLKRTVSLNRYRR